MNCEVARRVITRSAESVGEDAVGVTPAEFERLQSAGEFALAWHANGLDYGIPAEIDQWLKSGRHVLVNGSRGHLREAQERYPTLLPVLLTVRDEVLRERLLRRGREIREQIDQRLARNALFTEDDQATKLFFNSIIRATWLTPSITCWTGSDSAQYRIKFDLAPSHQSQNKKRSKHATANQRQGDFGFLEQRKMQSAAQQGEDQKSRG